MFDCIAAISFASTVVQLIDLSRTLLAELNERPTSENYEGIRQALGSGDFHILNQLVCKLSLHILLSHNDPAFKQALKSLLSLCLKVISIPWRQRLGLGPCLSHSDRIAVSGRSKTKNSLRTLKELLRGDVSSPRLLNLEPVLGCLRESKPDESTIFFGQPLRHREHHSRAMLESIF